MGFHEYACTRRGVNYEQGKWWCKQHSPSVVKARQDAMQTKYREDSAIRSAEYKRREAEAAACQGVDIEDLTQGILARLLAEYAKSSG